MHLHDGYVLYEPDLGVYLGTFLGCEFWSKLDPAGQDAAVTFKDEPEIQAHIETWEDDSGRTYQMCRIVTKDPNYATVDECVAVGLPGWEHLVFEESASEIF